MLIDGSFFPIPGRCGCDRDSILKDLAVAIGENEKLKKALIARLGENELQELEDAIGVKLVGI